MVDRERTVPMITETWGPPKQRIWRFLTIRGHSIVSILDLSNRPSASGFMQPGPQPMKDLNQDDAVERMLNQVEGVLKRQQNDVRAARRATVSLDDGPQHQGHRDASSLQQSHSDEGSRRHGYNDDTLQPDGQRRHFDPRNRPRTQDLIDDGTELEAHANDALAYDPYATEPEKDACDLDATAVELEAYDPDRTLPDKDVYETHATEGVLGTDDPDTAGRDFDAYEASPTVAQSDTGETAVSAAAEVDELPPLEPQSEAPEQPGGAHRTRRLTTRLGQLLVDTDLVSGPQLESALRRQQETGERLGAVLVNEGYIDEPALLGALVRQHGVPAADLDDIELDTALTKLIPHDMAQRYLLVPLALHADAVDVAMVDPTDFVAMAHVRFATGLRPNVFITTVTAAQRAIARLYADEDSDSTAQPRDPREAVKRMILERDSMLISADQDPRKFYELAASIDTFVDEIFRKASSCG